MEAVSWQCQFPPYPVPRAFPRPLHQPALKEENRLLAELKSRLEGSLAQLQLENSKLAAEEMIHRQRLETAQAFIKAFLDSSVWKLTGPIRHLRNLLRPRGCTTQHLLPVQHLEPVPGEPPGTWRACGHDPQFVVRCWMQAGWV